MVSFTATEVNINVLSVQDNGHLLFALDVMVGLLWDLKHQHVACRLSTLNSFQDRRGGNRVGSTGQFENLGG